MNDYVPVSCDFHDQLEALATLREVAQILYCDETGQEVEVSDYIVDVYAAHKADFIKLKNGAEIRLDQIISVNNNAVSFCVD